MKTHRTPYALTSFVILGACLAASSSAGAQTPWGRFGGAPTNVRLASSETDAFSLGQLAGKPLRGPSQEQLGSISDFLIEPASGRIHFAVVPSGGGAAGETFRLVPISALDHGARGDGLTVRINQDQWSRVGTMTQAELPARITLNADQLQRLSQQYTVAGQSAPDTSVSGELIRASSLKGQAVRSGNDQVGTVDDVAIDVRRQTAAAVVKSSSGFTGSEQRFLVPFAQLKAAGDANAGLTTTLGRNEFAQAQSLQPTGYMGDAFTRGGMGAHPIQSAAQQAVNQAAGSNVQVIAETKLLLRGTVDSEQKRSDAERAAIQAAPGLRVENQIDVRR